MVLEASIFQKKKKKSREEFAAGHANFIKSVL